MWNIQTYHSNLAVSNLGGVAFFDAPYNFEKMVEVLNQIILENDTFWLRFDEKKGEPFQYLEKPKYEVFEEFDFTEFSDEEIHEELGKHSRVVKNIKNSKMYEFQIFKYSENKIGVSAIISHLIFDAWSFPMIVDYVDQKYFRNLNGESIVDDGIYSYKDFLETISTDKLIQKNKKGKEFFETLYSESFSVSEITSSVINKEDIAGVRIHLKLDSDSNDNIKKYCAERNISLAVLFETALLIYLRRINNSDQTTIGLPTLNRKGKERKILGMFIGMLPMSINIGNEDKIEEVMIKNKDAHRNLFKFQTYKLSDISSYLFSEHNFEGNIFDIMFNYQNGKRESESHYNVMTRYYSNGASEVPLVMMVNERDNDAIEISYDYQINNLSEQEVLLIHERILYIVSQIIADKTLDVQTVDIVPPSEKKIIESISSGKETDYGDMLIHELFELQADNHADRIAAKDSKMALSYKELNERSNQFARMLIDLGAKRGSRVCVNMNNNVVFMIAFWGIIKSGAIYIPVDREYPIDRVKYIIKDSKAEFVITDNTNIYKSSSSSSMEPRYINSESLIKESEGYSKENIKLELDSSDSAYILYTSGTTGNPKGAENTHGGIQNRILWMQEHFGLTTDDVVLQKTSISFDVSVWELVWPFVAGATQVLADLGGSKDNDYIRNLIMSENITTVHFVPSILDDFLEFNINTGLTRIICSGEELKVETVNKARLQNPNTRITNLYGPTEAAIDVTYYDCSPNNIDKRIPIGKPVTNTQIKIVDEKMNVVPIGVAGELIICGVQVAKGYFGNEQLTNEKFGYISNDNPLRYYKTGDIAAWNTNGMIEYLGRKDSQIKINGVRIETSEIESQMKNIEGIKHAIVIDKIVNNKKVLVAFYVGAKKINAKLIRRQLIKQLPKKWIPSYFKEIEEVPLNHNGKINTNALKKIELTYNLENEFIEAASEKEIAVASAIKAVLKLDKLSMNDDFFSYGLDSIKCIKIVSNLASQGISISIEDLYIYPTVRELVEVVNTMDGNKEKETVSKFGLLNSEDMEQLLKQS